MSIDLKVDDEFKGLIPPLSEFERGELEKSIVSMKKLISPIVTWDGIILDGHNRFEICSKHMVEYSTVSLDLKDRSDAKLWIINNQFSRRNLTAIQRIELALTKKALITAEAKENQRKAGGAVSTKSTKAVNTRKEIAKLAGVSENTIDKAEAIFSRGTAEDKKEVRDGRKSINAVYKRVEAKKVNVKPVEEGSDAQIKKAIARVERFVKDLIEVNDPLTSEHRKSIGDIVRDLQGYIEEERPSGAAASTAS
jgi:hypothetical protein